MNPDLPYLDLLKDVGFRPFFIMGDHRSGTTLLYQLLAETQCFNIVTAYHVIRYNQIVFDHMQGAGAASRRELSDTFAQLGLKDRVLDGVAVSPDLPEEYGFVIDGGPRPQLTPSTLPKFVELCRKIQFTSEPNRPILLKNPWDILRFAYVKECFPQAKLIFIHRHPLTVINSQLRAIRSLLETKSAYTALTAQWYREMYQNPVRLFATRLLFSSRFQLAERITARHIRLVADYYLRNIGSIPKTDYVSIRYEDLCENPDRVIQEILDFGGCRDHAQKGYQDRVHPRSLAVLPGAEAAFQSVRAKLGPFLALHGYD